MGLTTKHVAEAVQGEKSCPPPSQAACSNNWTSTSNQPLYTGSYPLDPQRFAKATTNHRSSSDCQAPTSGCSRDPRKPPKQMVPSHCKSYNKNANGDTARTAPWENHPGTIRSTTGCNTLARTPNNTPIKSHKRDPPTSMDTITEQMLNHPQKSHPNKPPNKTG